MLPGIALPGTDDTHRIVECQQNKRVPRPPTFAVTYHL